MEQGIDYAGLFRDLLARKVSPYEARRDVLRKRYGSLEAAARAAGIHVSTLDLLCTGWAGGEKTAEARAVYAQDLGLPERELFSQGQEAA